MLRLLLIAFAPLLLPAACYVVWRIYRQATTVGLGAEIDWSETPWHWLVATGLALLIVTLVAVSMFGRGDAGDRYIPPKLIDGKIVPGRTVPKEER